MPLEEKIQILANKAFTWNRINETTKPSHHPERPCWASRSGYKTSTVSFYLQTRLDKSYYGGINELLWVLQFQKDPSQAVIFFTNVVIMRDSGHGLKQSLEGFVAKGNQNDFDREGLHLLRTHAFSRFPFFLSSIPMKGSFYGEADYKDSMESEVYYVALIWYASSTLFVSAGDNGVVFVNRMKQLMFCSHF